MQDRDAIAPLLAVAGQRFASLKKAIADGIGTLDDLKRDAGLILYLISRRLALIPTVKGFYVLPKRWIVERTYGWLGRCRSLGKDYENLSRSHVGFIILAMIRLMLRRIVRFAGAT